MSDKTIQHCRQAVAALKMCNLPAAGGSRWVSMDIRVGMCPVCGLVIQRRYRASAERELLAGRKGWEDVPKAEHAKILRAIERMTVSLVRFPATSEHTINLSKPVDHPLNRRAVRAYG